MKRITALLLIFVMCMAALPVLAAEADEMKSAVYVFNNDSLTKNITHYWLQDTHGSLSTAEYQGKSGVWLGANANFYALFNIDDAYWYSKEAKSIAVTVEYFDEGNTSFTLRYESPSNVNDEPEIVRCTDTKEWKTHTFYIDDMLIANGPNMCDVMIALWSNSMGWPSGSVFFHSIKVEEIFPPKPIKTSVTSDSLGNVFNLNGEKRLDIKFNNIVDFPGEAWVEYKITDGEGKIVKEGESEKITIDALGEKNVQIPIDVAKCDLYRFDYTLKGSVEHDGKVTEFSVVDYALFSVALTHTFEDEKNEKYWIGAHATYYYPANTPENTMEMIIKAGFGGNRSGFMDITWPDVDYAAGTPTDGILAFDWEYELVKESNQPIIEIAHYGHPALYGDGRDKFYMPRTELEIERFIDYCVQVAVEYESKNMPHPLRLEIWNEPNNTHFNHDLENEDAEYYANLMKKCYPRIKEAAPSTIVVGMVTVGSGVGWITEVLSYDCYDYMDEIAIHPYSWAGGKAKFDSIIGDTQALKKVMSQYGELKPIIFTEIGWHDTGFMNELGSLSGTSMGVTSAEQAKNAVLLPTICNAYNLTDIVSWYDLQNDGEVMLNSEHNFGLVESPYNKTPYAAKESYLAVCAYNKFLPNAKFEQKIERDGLQTAAFNFTRTDGENCAVMWTYNGNEQMSIDLGTESIEAFDLYGNSMGVLKSESGVYTFNVTDEPMYIMGQFEKFEEAEAVIDYSEFTESVPDDAIPVEFTDKLGRDMNINVEFSDDALYIEGDAKMTSGKANFYIKSKNNTLGQHFVRIKLYDEENIYFAGEYAVWIRTPFSFDMQTLQVNENNAYRWQTAITVKNLAYTSHLNGTIELVAPESFLDSANKVTFTDLRPKEERTFYINLPEMIKKRTVNITARTTLDNGYVEDYTSTVDFTTAYYMAEKPVLDGVLGEEEWKGEWVFSDKLENIDGGTFKQNWRGESDLSMRAKFGWDEENFYLGIIATDDVFSQDYASGNQWQGDGLQLGFEDINPQGKFENKSYTEFGLSLYKDEAQAYRWSCLYNIPAGEVTNFEAKIVHKDGTTTYEAIIPWSEIFEADYDITKMSEIGFSFIINDNDGEGRRGWILYNDGIGIEKNALKFGRMKLIK